MDSSQNTDEDRRVSQMGYFGWRPAFLERFNTPAFFTTAFSFSNFFIVIPYGIFVVIIPTLESVFNLNTKQIGLIIIANDISGMVAAVVVTNYCSAKKVRWIGLGMMVVVIAFLIPASSTLFVEYPKPKNITGSISNVTDDGSNMMGLTCASDMDSIEAGDSEGGYAIRNYRYYPMFIFGYLLQGIGITPPLTAGLTYLDEIFPQKKFAIAFAALTIFSFIGYPFAMVLGSIFLGWYVTLSMPEGMTTHSKEFVGAWWLGYVIPSVIAFFLTFIVLLYPQQMPAAKAVLKGKVEQGITTAKEKTVELNQSLLQQTKSMIPKFKRLMQNKALDFLIIGDVLFFLQTGINSFGPKLYIKMFRLKPTSVGKILGITHGSGFVIGILLGGILVKWKDWEVKKLLQIFIACSLVSIPFLLGILLYCPTTENKTPISEECNSDCMCSTELYDPVCDTSTATTHFSPCYAGCHDFVEDSEKKNRVAFYSNCTCVPDAGRVVPGECGASCTNRMWLSLAITTTQSVIKYGGFVAVNVIYQRVVAESDRTAAQGLRQFARKALGTLPSPLLFGWIIDQHCDIWRVSKNGTVGNCWVYDVDRMIMWLCVVQVALRLLSCGFYFLCWWVYPDKKYVPFPDEPKGTTAEKSV